MTGVEGSTDGGMDTATARAWLHLVAEDVHARRDHLTELDRAIGDGDHGVNLDRGFTAAEDKLAQASPQTPGAVLGLTGRTLISTVGGASGPLFGTLFREAGKRFGEETTTSGEAVATGLRAGLDGVQRLGKAENGDKTMVDAWAPALDALEAALAGGASLPESAKRAAEAAEQGLRDTVPMQARKGRASYLGPRSVGHEDPGAASSVLVLSALARVLTGAGPA